ncbi:hypothetical protein COP1_041126 [Malus domestica]
MGSPAVFVQLSVLLPSCFTIFGNIITTLPAIPPHHSVHCSHPVANLGLDRGCHHLAKHQQERDGLKLLLDVPIRSKSSIFSQI